MWTLFWDMHSGGGTKEKPYEKIYIEAPEKEAKIIFYNRFGHSPERVTCTCCGEDYSISEAKTLAEASGYHRGCAYEGDGYVEKPSKDGWARKYVTLKEYKKQKDVLVIPASQIKPEERVGEVPSQGYVWVD